MSAPRDEFVLDRFEEGVALLVSDSGETVAVPGLTGREGDVFVRQDGEWLPDPAARQAREARIRGKMDRLFGGREKKT